MALAENTSLFTVLGGHQGAATHAHFIQGKINLYKSWTEGVPAGASCRISESGWMDTSVFLLKSTRLFLRAVAHLTKTATVLLLLDGHHPHISLDLIRTACDSNVILLCLPTNTTHPLQPLDAGVFGPLKTTWRSILKKYKLEARSERVCKEVFPSLVAP